MSSKTRALLSMFIENQVQTRVNMGYPNLTRLQVKEAESNKIEGRTTYLSKHMGHHMGRRQAKNLG